MIAGILFSNIPFNASSFLIDSYEKTNGVVDKIWLVQQENNTDVVDTFESFRGVAEKLKIREARAATLTIVLNNTQTILTEGTSWTVPAGWTSANNTIEVIGGGGSGFTDTTGIAGAGGGGGGAYSLITNLTLTPGATVAYQIGNGGKNAALNGGDTFFNRTAGSAGTCADTSSICAKGGTGATSVTGAAGGVGTSGIGATRLDGGTGGTGNTTGDTAGGGGGAGGPNVAGKAGGTGTSGTPAIGDGGGGGGGNGGTSSTVGAAATTIGGAGGAGNLGTGGGTGGSAANGGNGTTSGAGGGGSDAGFNAGNGFGGTNLGGGVGPGGGGGGAGDTTTAIGSGGDGGLYGGGGGGGRYGGRGAPGIIIITYNGITPTKTTWTVPSDWDNANNTIEVIGGGGSAYSGAQGIGASGGGGGAYSKATNVTLTPGSTVAYAIGNGGRKTAVGVGVVGVAGTDTYFCNSTTNCASITGTAVLAGAKGGAGGASATAGGAGGAAASGFPAAGVRWSGGAGGAGNSTGDSGGGGGGAAGSSQDGLGGGAGATTASIGGGGGGGAGDNSGTNSTVGEAGNTAATTGGDGGMGPLGTGGGLGGTGAGPAGTAGTGGGGAGGWQQNNGGNGGSGGGSATTYGGGGGGGVGDNNVAITGALSAGDGGLYGAGGGGGLMPGFGANGIIIITYTQSVVTVTASSTGTQTVNMDSGATAQSITAAFRFQQDSGTAANITGLTLTDTGSVIFNSSLSEEVSNISLTYKTVDDAGTCAVASESAPATGTLGVGTETVSWSGLTIPAVVGANYRCVFIKLDAVGAGPIYPAGGSTIDLRINATTDFTLSAADTRAGTPDPTGLTTVRPAYDTVSKYTNSSDPLLNWGTSCTGCGARIGPISTSKQQTIVINGKGFGPDPGSGSRDTATNKVEIAGATTMVMGDDASANQNVTAWSNTSITIRTNSELATNTDADWGTNFGDSAALRVTAGGQTVASDIEFFIFPQVTSISSNAERIGQNISLNGTRFGSSQSAGTVTILTVDAGAASAWGNTLITVTVPSGISPSSYTGNVIATQGAGANGKTHSYAGFRILPRVTSTGPVDTKGGQSSAVTIAGDHFCQDATCADYATDSDDTTFNAVSAKASYTAVSDTSISLSVPATATDGNLIVKSDSANGGTVYDSNSYSYNVKFGPSAPTGSSAGGSNNPTLSGNAFSDGTDGDSHNKTQWQLAHNTDGDWTTPEWSRTTTTGLISAVVDTTDGGAFANGDVGQTALDCGTTYKGRIRYMDNGNAGADTQTWEWSAYSVDYTFSTGSCNTLTVGVNGSQLANITRGTNNNSLGGTANPSGAFTFVTSTSAATITSIKVSEQVAGFIANNNLNNVKLYGDTGGSVTGQYEAGLDTQIGTTQTTFAADETVTFSGLSLAANTTIIYVYVVADIDADPTSGQTIEIEITASGDVAATGATVATAGFPKAITSSTTVANPNMTVASAGSQTANMTRGSTGNYVGGSFTLTMASANGSLTSFAVTENGTVASANLPNVKIYGDTGGSVTGTYEPGLDTQIGTTQSFTADKATFGSLSVGLTTSATYIYVVLDVNSSATAGQNIEIRVFASGDVVGTGFNVAGTFPLDISSATDIIDPSLTVSASGTQAVNLNSGDTNQHIGGGTGAGNTAAFRLQIGGASATVSSVKITDIGSVTFTGLTSPRLYYENTATCSYDANESNVTGTYTAETVTFSLASVSIGVSPNYTCLYYVSNLDGTNTKGGDAIDIEISNPSTDVTISGATNTDTVAKTITGVTTVRPQITGYTNSTEAGLDYAGSCAGCGARLGPASSSKSQTVVISGAGFGPDPGLGSRDTATNKVEIAGGATTLLADNGAGNTNVTSWAATSITITTDTAVTGNDDSSWGANFGGATALKITAGAQAVATNLNFYVFPQVTGLSVCNKSGFPVGDNAREYNAGDSACPNGLTDGQVILNGTRFGSSQGTGTVTIVSVDAGAASSWTNTAITANVPTSISDSVYTGNLAMQQGTGGNSKTHTYTTSGFRVLPRILNFNPTSPAVGDNVEIIGNHLCQAGAASCPTVLDVDNKVTFTSGVDATVRNTWVNGDSSTVGVNVQVPTGAVTGNVVVKSNTYNSNPLSITLANPTPTNPTTLEQHKDTQGALIAVSGGINETTADFKMNTSSTITGGTMYAQVEIKAVGTAFTSPATCSNTLATCFEGVSVSYPTTGTVSLWVDNIVSGTLTTNNYHWQARVKYNKSAVDYLSGWVSYPSTDNGTPNAESVIDFYVDTTAPIISNIASSNVTASGATITWTTNEISDSKVKYGTSCPPSSETSVSQTSGVTNHSVVLSGLSSDTTYQYQAVSADRDSNGNLIGNSATGPSAGTCNTFQTSKANTKTIEYFITGETGKITTVMGEVSRPFTIYISESNANVQNVFVELSGVSDPVGAQTIRLRINSQTNQDYELNASTYPTPFTILHKVNSADLGVFSSGNSSNTLYIRALNADISVVSAKVVVTYYAPPQ